MTFMPRFLSDGRVCCSSINRDGVREFPIHPCDVCQRYFATIGFLKTEEQNMNDYAPVDSYAAALAARRAAEETPESRFAERHKAARLRDLDIESAELREHFATKPGPRLTTAELAPYAPPDSYAIALKALKEAR